ncbi:hypothetical protein M9458_027197, partial [Cirrhinus mrigala]
MPIKECCACGGPVELPDAHDACVFCLGRAYAEAALDGPDCPFCEEMTVKTLRARVSVILNCAPANPLPPPPVAVACQFLYAHHSKEPPVSFTKASLRPSDDARDLVSFGAAEDDLDDVDDAMSTAASGSGDWSACLESEASHSEVREPPAPIDEELVKILSEAVQDLGLDWSPPEQPTKNRLDMRYLQSGRQVAAPQRPAPFFPEVHEETSRSWRSPYSARAQAAGSRMLSSVDGADRWGYTKPPPVEEAVAAHLCPSARGWKSAPSLPSKPCRTTSHIADKAYMAAGQAASAIHTMAVLQAFQAKMLQTLPDSAAFKKLRSATDLALRATKKTAQGIGRCMGSLVTLQRHLWLTLTVMRESEKAQLLDAPISPLGLFGDAVGSPRNKRSVRCTPTTFQILFFPAFKKARKTAAYSFRGSEGQRQGSSATQRRWDHALNQCGTRSTAAGKRPPGETDDEPLRKRVRLAAFHLPVPSHVAGNSGKCLFPIKFALKHKTNTVQPKSSFPPHDGSQSRVISRAPAQAPRCLPGSCRLQRCPSGSERRLGRITGRFNPSRTIWTRGTRFQVCQNG